MAAGGFTVEKEATKEIQDKCDNVSVDEALYCRCLLFFNTSLIIFDV